MTEEEAKAQWCPMRSPGLGATTAKALRCIASDCMAWRTVGETMGPRRVHPDVLADGWAGWAVTDPEPDAKGYVEISPPSATATGFCGLAGALA